MALGNVSNNQNTGKYYPTVYSPLVFYNDDAAFNFRFALSGILEMKMAPRTADGKFDDKNGLAIYISPNKAVMLSKAISLLKNDIKENKVANYGVCNNKKTGNIEFGYNKQGDDIQLYCTIYKYGQDGNISDNYTFIFKVDEYIVKNFSPNDLSFDSINVYDLPLTMIQNLLDEYVKSMTGAVAYGVEYSVGQYKYNVNSLKKMLGGGEQKSSSSNSSGGGNSIFNNNGNGASFTNGDVFDLE